MLDKIFKPRVKPDPEVNRPKRGAPCGHRGNSRDRPEEISEFIDIYPEKCDKCGGRIKAYEKNYDEHVVEDIEIKKKVTFIGYIMDIVSSVKELFIPKQKKRYWLVTELEFRLERLVATCAILDCPTGR